MRDAEENLGCGNSHPWGRVPRCVKMLQSTRGRQKDQCVDVWSFRAVTYLQVAPFPPQVLEDSKLNSSTTGGQQRLLQWPGRPRRGRKIYLWVHGGSLIQIGDPRAL